MKRIKRINGFVMNKITGHASYAFKQMGKMVNSIGFTHNKNDIAEKKKLKYNINPKDSASCFVKTKVEEQKYNTYRISHKYEEFRIHESDKKLIDSIIKKRR